MESTDKIKKKNRFGFLIWFLAKIIIVTGILYAVYLYVAEPYRNDKNNMFPMVNDGDLCIIYKLDDYFLDDVVLYRTADGEKRLGRVMAIAGQEVDFPEEGGYTINEYSPAEKIPFQTFRSKNSRIEFPLTVKKDQLFLMNDLREDTKDGREMGPVSKNDVIGKLIFVLRRRGF